MQGIRTWRRLSSRFWYLLVALIMLPLDYCTMFTCHCHCARSISSENGRGYSHRGLTESRVSVSRSCTVWSTTNLTWIAYSCCVLCGTKATCRLLLPPVIYHVVIFCVSSTLNCQLALILNCERACSTVGFYVTYRTVGVWWSWAAQAMRSWEASVGAKRLCACMHCILK